MDRYVGRIVYPDWYVELINMWNRTFILIGMWIRSIFLTAARIHDRYVVSPAVILIVTWSHLQLS